MNRTAAAASRSKEMTSNDSNLKKEIPSKSLTSQQITNYSYATAGAVIAFFLLGHLIIPRIPQMSAYHDFADKRKVIGIPYFFNVISNIPFLLVGIQGMNLLKSLGTEIHATERKLYNAFFVFVFFGGIGSCFYHLFPNNFTLLFDRLPLTAACMALLAAIIGDRVSQPMGLKLLSPLLIFGTLTALYWEYTELRGVGDIRAYAFANFLPSILIPLILSKMPKRYSGTEYLWSLVTFFTVARVSEIADTLIYLFTFHYISGHTIKHLALAYAVHQVVQYLKNRKPQNVHQD